MPFTSTKRPLLAGAAVLCFAAAVVLTPSDVRSQLDVRQRDPAIEVSAHVLPSLAPVVPAGDAFAPRVEVDDDPHPTLAQNTMAMVPHVPPALAPRPLKPPPAAARVTAIATGSQPTAIVEDGGTERLVAVGDPLGGSTVAAIREGGVVLRDGRLLSLMPAERTP
jgi:hypothetical protein